MGFLNPFSQLPDDNFVDSGDAMLIPYGTDAPLYRPPWGTFSLIAANILLFFLQDRVTPDSLYVLRFGDGLHPVQWFLATFAHADYCHLISNMIFLFSFGIVVESMMKLRYFLTLYVAIAVVHHIAIQIMMLGSASGGALGASVRHLRLADGCHNLCSGTKYQVVVFALVCSGVGNFRSTGADRRTILFPLGFHAGVFRWF